MAIIPDAVRKALGAFSLREQNSEAFALGQHAQYIRQLQEKALAKARENPTGADGKITLLDYYKAADSIIGRENARLEPEARLTLSQLVDFRGQKLEGIEFRKEHLSQLEKHYEAHDFSPGALDAVERNLAFDRAELANVTFIPATALEALNVDRRSHVRLEDATFIGMKEGEVLRIEASSDGTPHRGIHFSNIQGGTLELGEGAKAENVHAQGAVMHIVMGGHSQLSQLQTDNATRIISFAAAPGAVIEDAVLRGATIAPGSSLAGTTWRNVALHEVNLKDVNFSGAEFRGVTFNGEPATFQTLRAAGIAENQLPASIDGSQLAAIAPPTPQQIAMAEARKLLDLGAYVTGDAPNGTNPNKALPVTAEVVACKGRENQAFADSVAALSAIASRNA